MDTTTKLFVFLTGTVTIIYLALTIPQLLQMSERYDGCQPSDPEWRCNMANVHGGQYTWEAKAAQSAVLTNTTILVAVIAVLVLGYVLARKKTA